MNRRSLIVLACLATPTISLAGCSSQKYHYGSIMPIYSRPLPMPARLVAQAEPQRVDRSVRRYRPRVASAAQASSYRYESVLGGPPLPNVRSAKPKNAELKLPGTEGTWHVTGGVNGCYIQLNNQALLDLYRANVMGCAGGALAEVTSWRRSDRKIELIERGGSRAATFESDGKGAFKSSSTSDGTPLELSR